MLNRKKKVKPVVVVLLPRIITDKQHVIFVVHVDELPVSPLWVFKLPFDPEHPGQIVSELVIPFIARDVNASSNRATLLNLQFNFEVQK